MVLRPGYKQTEIGTLPVDWALIPLGQTMRLINGLAFKPEAWKTYGIPIIRIQNLNDPDGRFNYMIGPVDAKYRIAAGDLLFAWSGTTGTSFGARIWRGPTGVLNQHIFKVIPDCTKLTTAFALLALHRVQAAIEKQAHGFKASFVHVKKSDLVKVALPVPPLNEQKAIASALADVDALLVALERLIAKKHDIKHATMLQLSNGRVRLPAFNYEWVNGTLDDALHFIVGGGTPSRSVAAFWGNEIPWATVKDFASFQPNATQESITQAGLKTSATNLIPAGTVIISTRMALGKAVIYTVDVAINQDLKALFLRSNLSAQFMCYWFEANQHIIERLGSGSTVKGISLDELKKLPFPLLSLEEQTAIATVLTAMDAEIAALEALLVKTRALKQGMMQELLTGKTRLIKQGENHA